MSNDNAFFEELQTDFLNEVSFLLETYEEHMLGLENDDNKAEHLAQIFRVAHSIKGGAAAVGFPEFSAFAHIVEDLLSVLRTAPEFVNSEIISILLQSGDEFKNRVQMLKVKDSATWDVKSLETKIKSILESLTGRSASKEVEKQTTQSPISGGNDEQPKIQGVEFFELDDGERPKAVDNANHESVNEIKTQMSAQELSKLENVDSKKNNLSVIKNGEQNVKTESVNAVSEVRSTSTEDNKNDTKPNHVQAKAAHKTMNQIIKVDTVRVDNVLNAVGELVVLKNQIVQNDLVKNGSNAELNSIVDQIDKAVRELYDKTLSIRMTPLKSLFIKIQRIVRDVSLSLDKPVNLELKGEETEVERTVFELLGDPLVHLVRNAMDHGVEKKEIRKQKNKPEIAKVTVSASQMGGNVIIEISDDGGGINKEKVLNKAIEKKLIPDNINPDKLSDEEVFKYIFAPGFSTADKISDLSGRGVGLDVVKSNIEKVNGKINIESKIGQGSIFRLTIPLSTAITDGIVVNIRSERYILPIYTIKEIIRLDLSRFTEVPGQGTVAKVRDVLYPVVNLDPLLRDLPVTNSGPSNSEFSRQHNKDEKMLVILESGLLTTALPVDDVLGQAQVVVKNLSLGRDIPEVSGAAILGDGKTVLILDPNHIVKNSQIEAAA